MPDTVELPLGAEVDRDDGPCGDLQALVVDPASRSVTHLVVEPKHARGLGRLVPVELVEVVGQRLWVRCGTAEFNRLEEAEETELLLAYGGSRGTDDQAAGWPYYLLPRESTADLELGTGTSGMTMTVVYDRVPLGEIEIHGGDVVRATDGTAGTLQGCRVDARDHGLTHVLVREGHLWKRKEVAVPVEAVPVFTNDIRIALSRDQLRRLPAVDHTRPKTGA